MIIRLSTSFFETILVMFITSLMVESINASERLQEIILYTEANNTGKSKTFNENNLDLRADPIGRVAKSHCVVRGLWRIEGIFNSQSTLKFIENAHGDGKSGQVCGSWNTENRTAQYRKIKYVGAQALDTPGISLYTRSRFYGDEELYFEGNHLRLPTPISFSSFGFTGKDEWLIYDNTTKDGSAKCLKPNFDPIGDYSVTFNTNKTMVVGGISRGCNGAVVRIETTRSPTPNTRATTTQKAGKGGAGSHLQKYNNFIIPLTSSGYLYVRMNSQWVSM